MLEHGSLLRCLSGLLTCRALLLLCSILGVVTRDRPGLLVDIVSVLKDINVNVVSAGEVQPAATRHLNSSPAHIGTELGNAQGLPNHHG